MVAAATLFEQWYGSLEAFEHETHKDIEAGKLCKTDMPIILACIRRWHSDGETRLALRGRCPTAIRTRSAGG
jgi:hypothetical protein